MRPPKNKPTRINSSLGIFINSSLRVNNFSRVATSLSQAHLKLRLYGKSSSALKTKGYIQRHSSESSRTTIVCAGFIDIARTSLSVAEEAGVEPTRRKKCANLVLKTRHPTGDDALPLNVQK